MAQKKTTVKAKKGARTRKTESAKSKSSSDKIFSALKKKGRRSEDAYPRLKRDGDDA
jgi:hypothetical protein